MLILFHQRLVKKLNIEEDETTGRQVIAFTLDGQSEKTAWTGGVGIYLSEEQLKFTSFSVTYVLVEETQTGTANWRVHGNTNYTLKDPGNNDKVTYTAALSSNITKDGELKTFLKIAKEEHKANIVSAKFYITDIKLGFADITVGEAFSWANYGIDVSELSGVTFNGEAVADASAFAATEAGTLTFTVNKAGYVATTFTINVVAA